jgi:muramoyltetrapeptide carboxypeptidase LdcA involved in peptidoglycan recycling
MSSASTIESREFRSPQRKLVRFFQKSRDNWKRKCQAAKQRCKLLANQVRAVEKSREQWRAEAEAARRRVEELEQMLAAQKR